MHFVMNIEAKKPLKPQERRVSQAPRGRSRIPLTFRMAKLLSIDLPFNKIKYGLPLRLRQDDLGLRKPTKPATILRPLTAVTVNDWYKRG